MSLLDDPKKIIFEADMSCKLEACKEWINNHLPNSIKDDPNIFLTKIEYNNIKNDQSGFYGYNGYMNLSYKIGVISLIDSYGSQHNAEKIIGIDFGKIYLYIENDKIKLDIPNDGLLVLENVEDIPDMIMELILPLMMKETYVARELEQEIIKSRWSYRKGHIIFNYSNPELMLPHRTIYVKNICTNEI